MYGFNGEILRLSRASGSPRVQLGAIVDNKRLAAVLTQIRDAQQDRDHQRLANPKRTLR